MMHWNTFRYRSLRIQALSKHTHTNVSCSLHNLYIGIEGLHAGAGVCGPGTSRSIYSLKTEKVAGSHLCLTPSGMWGMVLEIMIRRPLHIKYSTVTVRSNKWIQTKRAIGEDPQVPGGVRSHCGQHYCHTERNNRRGGLPLCPFHQHSHR